MPDNRDAITREAASLTETGHRLSEASAKTMHCTAEAETDTLRLMSPTDRATHNRFSLSTFALCFALASVVAYFSHIVTFENVAQSAFNQRAVLLGEPFHFGEEIKVIEPYYNRIIFPYILKLFDYIIPSQSGLEAFLMVRSLTIFGCFLVVARTVLLRVTQEQQTLFLYAFTFTILATLNHPFVNPSDIFDLTFCFFMFLYIHERQFYKALFIALLTSFNRETGAFGAILYLCVWFGEDFLPVLLVRVASLATLPYITAILVRRIYVNTDNTFAQTGQWVIGFRDNWNNFVNVVHNVVQSPSNNTGYNAWPLLLFIMLIPPALLLFRHKQTLSTNLRIVLAFLAIFSITNIFGIISEVRIFLPLSALLLSGAIVARRPDADLPRI